MHDYVSVTVVKLITVWMAGVLKFQAVFIFLNGNGPMSVFEFLKKKC